MSDTMKTYPIDEKKEPLAFALKQAKMLPDNVLKKYEKIDPERKDYLILTPDRENKRTVQKFVTGQELRNAIAMVLADGNRNDLTTVMPVPADTTPQEKESIAKINQYRKLAYEHVDEGKAGVGQKIKEAYGIFDGHRAATVKPKEPKKGDKPLGALSGMEQIKAALSGADLESLSAAIGFDGQWEERAVPVESLPAGARAEAPKPSAVKKQHKPAMV